MNDNNNPDVAGTVTPSPVLVVEDDFLLRMAAAAFLEEAGFSVIHAANAREAIDLLHANREIGAVFTDIEMPPGMDGLALAGWIDRERPGVKVVIASGKVPGAAVPGRPFLSKPYRMPEVERLLRASREPTRNLD
jgi:DNA-binding NtrC family response regulator